MPKGLKMPKAMLDVEVMLRDLEIDRVCKAFVLGVAEKAYCTDYTFESVGFSYKEIMHEGVMINTCCVPFGDGIILWFKSGKAMLSDVEYEPKYSEYGACEPFVEINMADPDSIDKMAKTLRKSFTNTFTAWWKRINSAYDKDSPMLKFVKETTRE